VTLGYIITAAICTLIGGFGYALWGPATEQVVTANLSAGSLLALVLTALTAANPFSAFAVTLEPVALMLQQRLQKWRASRQQPGHGSSSGGSGKEVAGMAANTSSMDDIESSSSTLEVPYTVRATIRLGRWCFSYINTSHHKAACVMLLNSPSLALGKAPSGQGRTIGIDEALCR